MSILQTRNDAADSTVLWQAIERADWSAEAQDGNWEADYRNNCIKMLGQRDPAATAERLSVFLRNRPSAQLASYAAPILAQEHHYEAVPVLMRFALLDSFAGDPGDALISMKVPQAALVIIRRDLLIARRPEVFPDYEKELAALLGEDAGPVLGDWTRLYARRDRSAPHVVVGRRGI